MSVLASHLERAKAVDLLSIARERGLQLKGRRHLSGPCPHCGGTDRFWIDTIKKIFNCHKCGPERPQHGAIDLVMFLDGVNFKQAVEILVGHAPTPQRDRAPPPKAHDEVSDNREAAKWLWGRRTPITNNCPVGLYLRQTRGYHGAIPPTLGYLPANGKHPAAMIAAFGFCDEPEPGIIRTPPLVTGIHLTRLTPNGEKAETDENPGKIMLGPTGGLPIVLAPVTDGLGLAITEGIEDGLSVFEETGLGVWTAGSAGNMPKIAAALPPDVECVTIFAHLDNGLQHAKETARLIAAMEVEVHLKGRG